MWTPCIVSRTPCNFAGLLVSLAGLLVSLAGLRVSLQGLLVSLQGLLVRDDFCYKQLAIVNFILRGMLQKISIIISGGVLKRIACTIDYFDYRRVRNRGEILEDSIEIQLKSEIQNLVNNKFLRLFPDFKSNREFSRCNHEKHLALTFIVFLNIYGGQRYNTE